jgi:hypothetical protein
LLAWSPDSKVHTAYSRCAMLVGIDQVDRGQNVLECMLQSHLLPAVSLLGSAGSWSDCDRSEHAGFV